MIINTYNESSLHKTLKNLYSLNEGDQTEIQQDGHIYDILSKDGTVIEIQTANLSKLYPKISDAISKNHKCIIVHPIIVKKNILLLNKNGEKISFRKSPKTESIYSLFRELTAIYPLLLDKKVTLKIPLISMTEIRIKTDRPLQTVNKKRRFKKDWIKTDKKLEEIHKTVTLNSYKDYLSLLPETLPETFTSLDLKNELKKINTLPASAVNMANIMIWVLCKMELIVKTGTKNKFFTYKINKNYSNQKQYETFEIVK